MSSRRLPGGFLVAMVFIVPAAALADSAPDAGAIDYTQDTPPPGAGRRGGGPLFDDDDDPAPRAPAVASSWSTPVLARAAASTALVLVLIIGMGRLIRQLGGRLPGWLGGRSEAGAGGPGNAAARITQRLALSPRHQLAWVQDPGGATFVVAYGEHGISLLNPPAPPTFRDAMAQAAADSAAVCPPPSPPNEAAHAPAER